MDSADIVTTFSSVFNNWYLGTDGNPPSNNLILCLLCCTNWGTVWDSSGSMGYDNGTGSWGLGTAFPFIYDQYSPKWQRTAIN
ncbi:MAG: hypothetical protein R3C26_09780 [Calditrichia bacterium]